MKRKCDRCRRFEHEITEGAGEKVDTAASADYWPAVVDEFPVVCMKSKHDVEMKIIVMRYFNRQNLKAEDRRRLVLRNNKTRV